MEASHSESDAREAVASATAEDASGAVSEIAPALASDAPAADAPASAPAPATPAPAPPAPAPEKLWTRDYILSIAVNFFLLLNYYPLMTTMADYSIVTWGAAAGLAGAVSSVFILGAVFSRLSAGVVIDRVGRKRLMLAGLGANAVCSALYFVPMSLPAMIALRVIHGFMFGAASTAITTVATSIVPATRRGEGIGYYMLSVTMGSAVGPSIGIALAQMGSFFPVFAVATGCVTLSLALACLLRVPAPTGVGGYVPLTGAKPAPKQHRGIARVIEPAALPISFVGALLFFAYSSLLAYLSQFGQQTGLEQATSLFFIVYAATMFATRPATGKIFDRRGPHIIMVPAFVAFSAGMAVLGTAQSGAAVLVAAALCGFGVGTMQACGLALAVQATAPQRLGMANSTYYALCDMGVGLGPMLFGLFIPTIGIRGVYLAMAVVGLAALMLFLLVVRKK